MTQTVVVTVHLTPEEIEDGKINEAYQDAYKKGRQRDFAGAVKEYQTVVIPLAEKAKFNVPRNKFLFLAYQGIGDCDLSVKNFVEAEQVFQKTLEFAPVWPGLDDSAIPNISISIAMARIGQENWKGAEDSLLETITTLDHRIESATHSDSKVVRSAQANGLRMYQDIALNLMAVVRFREGRPAEAQVLLEKAYKQAVEYHAPMDTVREIVDEGLVISVATGNGTASATWSERAKSLK